MRLASIATGVPSPDTTQTRRQITWRNPLTENRFGRNPPRSSPHGPLWDGVAPWQRPAVAVLPPHTGGRAFCV